MARKAQPRKLGRGLSSLISEPVSIEQPSFNESQIASSQDITKSSPPSPSGDPAAARVLSVDVASIVPNINQPRKRFDDESLNGLASSITVSGVIQPVLVRRLPDAAGGPDGAAWELIAGERRWRAAKLAGLTHIPAVEASLSDRESAEWALVENLQREDLNPVERAGALKRLRDEFGLTQSQVAEQVGLDRATVANLIRLTELEPEILELLAAGTLTAGHGKALLSHPAGPSRVALAHRAAKESWSVRALEKPAAERTAAPKPSRSPHLLDLEKQLGDHLGTKLSIKQNTNGKGGTISIRYFDLDHFDGLLEQLRFQRRG